MQLSFYYSDNNNSLELREKFITVGSGVEQLFNELLDLPPSRQLDVEVSQQSLISNLFSFFFFFFFEYLLIPYNSSFHCTLYVDTVRFDVNCKHC